MSNSMKNQNKSNIIKILTVVFSVSLVIIITAVIINNSSSKKPTVNENNSSIGKNNDLVIPISEISNKVNFFPVEIDGTKLEVMAVKASDGSIRTAFNTCQVCYSSGRGYYVQEGDELVCQNCGNRFGMDDVEVTKGGCNPVPITSNDKTANDTSIIISKEFLSQSKSIFANWKN